MKQDISDSASAAKTDSDTLTLMKGLIKKDGTVDPAVKAELTKNLKDDMAGDVGAGGAGVAKGKTKLPTDVDKAAKNEGMDATNARTDAKMTADAQEILKRGVQPDGKTPLTDAQKDALTKSITSASTDEKNSLKDSPLETQYAQHDQALLTALKSGNVKDIQAAAAAVAKDRSLDMKNEGDPTNPSPTSYIGNDQSNLASATNAVKEFGKSDAAATSVVGKDQAHGTAHPKPRVPQPGDGTAHPKPKTPEPTSIGFPRLPGYHQ